MQCLLGLLLTGTQRPEVRQRSPASVELEELLPCAQGQLGWVETTDWLIFTLFSFSMRPEISKKWTRWQLCPPHRALLSLIQLLTLVFVSWGEGPLADGVVGRESLFGDGVVSGDGHGQDARVGDHSARGRLATVSANVRAHWEEKGEEYGQQGGRKKRRCQLHHSSPDQRVFFLSYTSLVIMGNITRHQLNLLVKSCMEPKIEKFWFRFRKTRVCSEQTKFGADLLSATISHLSGVMWHLRGRNKGEMAGSRNTHSHHVLFWHSLP